MNNPNTYLHDIELPNTDSPDFILMLLVIMTVILFMIVGLYLYQRQRPLARAKRQLHLLSTTTPDPHALAALLQQKLQVQRLSDSALPKDFLQRLDHARFSANSCHLENFIQLKDEAKHFLEQEK